MIHIIDTGQNKLVSWKQMPLTDPQLERLSEFIANIGLVFIAGVVTPLFSESILVKPLNAVLGLFASFIAVMMSLTIAKGIKR